MADEPLDPPPPTPASAVAAPAPLLRPRRVAFEHGLLPIPKLIFPEGALAQTLSQLKDKLAPAAVDGRVSAAALADALQIPPDQAALALGMLAAVHPADDPALGAGGDGSADLRDVLLFLYIQSYKRLVPRPHKDSPAVADVWPSTSAFDGYLSALSPIQLVRSNSRRFIPSQADEEIHQLSYLQKHMANILTLLADSVEGEGDDSLVLTMETFEHLGFLLHFSQGTSLSQAATFFANSDPDMPAAPVSAAQVHDWILQNIASSLEFYTEKSIAKEGSQQIASDLDVTMADANTSHSRNTTPTGVNPAFHRNSTFVEGFSKTSVVKHASDVKGHSVKVLNCHDSVIYILAPLKYATVYGCSDTTVVLGAVGKVVKVEHCERVHIIAAAKRICIANCRECIFYLGVNHQPLIVGDNHKLHIAPFNTYYPRLGEHMMQVGVDPSTNKWDQPFVLGVVDPHDSLSHPAGVSDVQAESATCVDPDLFTNFLELQGYTRKQGSTRTMKNLLRKRDKFDYHASPRMVPHVYKPEVKYVKLSIEKYVPHSKKIKVDASCVSPILNKLSEEDGQLIARYFIACKEDIWKPSLVAFPSFQVSPCDIYKVPHSFRTTDMLVDAMQQLQDLSFSTTKNTYVKCGSPLRESADVATVKDQAPEVECPYFSSGEVALSKSVCVPSSPVNKYPLHSFFSGDYVTVDVGGFVSITFVPALPRSAEINKDKTNINWQQKVQNKTTPFSGPTTDGAYSRNLIFVNNASSLAPHSPEYSKHDHDEHNIHPGSPSNTFTSPREKWDSPCNTKPGSPVLSVQQDSEELSPRLTHYIEEGIVPESPILDVNHQQLEIDSAANACFIPKVCSSKTHGQGVQTNGSGCQNGPLSFWKKGQISAGVTEFPSSSRDDVLDKIQARTEEPMCPSNAKMCSPAAHTPTANLLCDSLSDEWQVNSVVGDTSGSVQQAPKYRRLCKFGDKIKRVSSVSLNNRYDRFVEGQYDLANKTMPNQMEHAIGNKGKAKRRLDIYIDEEVEVSEDANISVDEDDGQSDDKYEDSFIDDQTTPTGQFTQSEQGGQNTGDMMAFYRRSLLTQSTVVLPSRYQDVSDNSAYRAGSSSCSSGNLHNPIETPRGIPQTHDTTGPSPLGSMERASSIKEQGEASVINCESTTKLDSRKRKLSFQQAVSIPVINLEPEPELEPAPPSAHLTTGVNNDIYWDDDAFFESLDFDAIEAQATEQLRLQKAQSAQKPAETKRASDLSFPPPSFDLGF